MPVVNAPNAPPVLAEFSRGRWANDIKLLPSCRTCQLGALLQCRASRLAKQARGLLRELGVASPSACRPADSKGACTRWQAQLVLSHVAPPPPPLVAAPAGSGDGAGAAPSCHAGLSCPQPGAEPDESFMQQWQLAFGATCPAATSARIAPAVLRRRLVRGASLNCRRWRTMPSLLQTSPTSTPTSPPHTPPSWARAWCTTWAHCSISRAACCRCPAPGLLSRLCCAV